MDWQPIATHPKEDGARFLIKMSDDTIWPAEYSLGPPGKEEAWSGLAIDCGPSVSDGSIPNHDAEITHWSPPEQISNNATPWGNSPREIQRRAMKARTAAITNGERS